MRISILIKNYILSRLINIDIIIFLFVCRRIKFVSDTIVLKEMIYLV